MIRILLADDQKSIREALRVRLEAEADFEIVGTASDGHTAIELAEILHPDIILLDMEMPGIGGVEVTQLICQAIPDVKVLVLSAHNDDQYINQAIHAGAMGYLLKTTPSHELREAIRFVHRGYSQLGPGVLNKIVATESSHRQYAGGAEELQQSTQFSNTSLTPVPRIRVNAEVDGEHFISSNYTAAAIEGSDASGWGLDIPGILRRRWLPILAAFSTTMAAMVVHTFLLEEPTYVSELWIQVSNKSSVPVASLPEEDVVDVEKDVSKGRTTEVQILQSSPLISEAIALLPIAYRSELKVKDVKDNLTVKQAEEDGLLSNVLIAGYTDSDPKRTQAVLDALGKASIQYNAATTRSRATSAIKFIEETLPGTRNTLNQANASVRNFRKQYGMVNPDTYAEDLTKTKLSLTNEIRAAEIAVNQAESRVKSQQRRLQSLGQNPLSAPLSAVLGQDDGYQALAKQLRDIQVQLNLQQTTLGVDHPTIQNLKEQQSRVTALLQQRAQNLLGGAIELDPTYSGTVSGNSGSSSSGTTQESVDANAVLADLSAQLLQAQTDLETQRTQLASLRQAKTVADSRFQQLPKLQETYGELQRQVNLHSARLERLLQKLQELKIAAAQETSPWTILEPPELPKKPTSPNIPRNLFFGVIFGLAMGLAIALLLERLDSRLRYVREVRELADFAILGSIPNRKLQLQRQRDSGGNLVPSYSCSAFEEAFRSLALQIQYLSSDSQIKTLAITSAESGEGKSTITYELGLTLARLGLKVLLIDADLHCPTLHLHAKLANMGGLSSVLQTNGNWRDTLQRGEVANLSLLNAGAEPVDSLALLRSETMSTVLQECRQQFDYVLIDTPPLVRIVDAQGLAPIVDSTVLVVGLNQTTRQSVTKALSLLHSGRNQIAGIIVNFQRDRLLPQPKLLASGAETVESEKSIA
jgi:capsular exopolysaccharide synthesis family protein